MTTIASLPVLAVDVGGTKLEAGLVDADGCILGRRRAATTGDDGDALFEQLMGLVEPLMAEGPVAGIGVGCGGPMSNGGSLVSPLNIGQWRDFPLADRLAERTGSAVVGDNDAVRAMLEAVPGLRLTLDVGHVTAWGGDPIELLAFADHVQLRQARVGAIQSRSGSVDFAGILDTLASLDYAGRLSVEYFDLPERGWGFDDPRGAALETAREIRALFA